MSESLEALRGKLIEVLEDPNTRWRAGVRLSQLHRNEWPALWQAIDEIVAYDPYEDAEGEEGEDEAQPEAENGWGEAKAVETPPESPMEATLDEEGEIVSAQVVENPGDTPKGERAKYDEFTLPDNPE